MTNGPKSSNDSYLIERLENLKITEEDIQISVHDPDYPPQTLRFFTADNDENINILYLTPSGEPIKYDRKGKLIQFSRKRLRIPKDGIKYTQPYKSGIFPFITPGIIKKYQAGQKIKTLFIVEGEFKAFSGDLFGLDIIGIAGIHSFKDKQKNELDEYVLSIINKCQVRNIVFLFDADCLEINYQPGKDLYIRPNNFYSAVRNFKELTKSLNIDIYFSHILPKHKETAKGLDDLINHRETDLDLLKKELNNFTAGKNRKYIHCINISENSIAELRKYFAIDSVDNFYLKYSDIIREEEFIYNRSRYRYTGEKLEMIRHGDADLFIRVSCEYFKKVHILNSDGEIESALKKWRKSEIGQDYINKGYKDFYDQIRKYDGFCNIPDNTSDYKREHELIVDDKLSKNYNIYEPFKWTPQEGTFNNTLRFLKHISDNKTDDITDKLGDPFTIILDYLTILLENPTQILPIIVLVSKEQETGKTTFFDWLKLIYKSNAVILSISEFKMDFNVHYSTKLLLMVDEGFFDREKKQEKERIKKLATTKKIQIQYKGADLFESDYYGKIIIASNFETDFIPLEKTDIRFFILKVPSIEKKDPDFLSTLKDEIPAFLYYLKHRKIFHPKESRAWFNEQYLITEQQQKIIETTKSRIERDIEDLIKDYMLTYNTDEFRIDATQLTSKINENVRYRYSPADIRRFLKIEKDMIPEKVQRYTLFEEFREDPFNKNDHIPNEVSLRGRPYTFKAKDWLNENELQELE